MRVSISDLALLSLGLVHGSVGAGSTSCGHGCQGNADATKMLLHMRSSVTYADGLHAHTAEASQDALIQKHRQGPYEPPDTMHTIKASDVAVSLLKKFRICGHEELIRVGPYSDGGYVIPSWPGPTAKHMSTMFSIGIRDADPVSHVVSDRFGINAHLFDCTSGASPCPADLPRCNVTFHHICAGGQDGVYDLGDQKDRIFQSIQSMVQQHAPGNSNDLILKIDCEGCEWDAFDTLPIDTLNRFGLLITEMHLLDLEENHEESHKQYLRIMTKLTQNFAIVHTHACNCNGQVRLIGNNATFNIPRVVEATFVRKDLLTSSLDCSTEADYSSLDAKICQEFPELGDETFHLPERAE